MADQKHSPLPWRVNAHFPMLHDRGNRKIADCGAFTESDVNARFIVTACNAHHELVDLARAVIHADDTTDAGEAADRVRVVADMARAALAKVEA
jgi:hypothetical protein